MRYLILFLGVASLILTICLYLNPSYFCDIIGYFYSDSSESIELKDHYSFLFGIEGTFLLVLTLLFQQYQFIVQKEQFDIQLYNQNSQYHRDKIDDRFFKIFDIYIKTRDEFSYKFNNQNLKGDQAFGLVIEHIKDWTKEGGKWTTYNKSNWNNDYEFKPRPKDFSFETIDIEYTEFVFKAVGNEVNFGKYFRVLSLILGFIKVNNLSNYLVDLEAVMGKEERVYLYYYIASRRDNVSPDTLEFLKKNRFLYNVNPKHLIERENVKLLYEGRDPSINTTD
ncbi:hypothetical protein [Echinicola shivajiensis]|uniref:hypothetical protein n=1 Tax=Echinicola shivajiensis TaxID=1035916 RepID=UPI001BFC2C64|nr:hypothetical protein [Echinicola shivajiensis]